MTNQDQINEWLHDAKNDKALKLTRLFESIQNHCVFPWKRIKAVECEPGIAGGIHYELGEIHVCRNALVSKQHLEETLTHELIHVYDMCRAHFDPYDLTSSQKQYDDDDSTKPGNDRHCQMIACTEIRAAALSGDCSMLNEFFRGQFFSSSVFGIGQFRKCVERRAALATSVHPVCKGIAEESVKTVFKSCVNDTAPFHPNDDGYVKYEAS